MTFIWTNAYTSIFVLQIMAEITSIVLTDGFYQMTDSVIRNSQAHSKSYSQ